MRTTLTTCRLANVEKDVNILKVKSEIGDPLRLEQLLQVEGGYRRVEPILC
jgi:hypothetical protein